MKQKDGERQRERNRFDLFSHRVPKAEAINCGQEFCILISEKKN